jgi:hypothetical protein
LLVITKFNFFADQNFIDQMKRLGIIGFMLVCISSYGQKVKLVEGDLKALAGQSSINVEFTYDNMTIGNDELKEEDYIARKKKDYNAKEAGRGEKWEKAWVADRHERFEPQFIELFEKYSDMQVAKGNARYTLIFHTTRTEPGWNVGVMRAAARIDAEVTIVENTNRSKVVAKMTVTNAPGRDAMGYDFDTGYRIQEAYAKSGKEVGKLIVKTLK